MLGNRSIVLQLKGDHVDALAAVRQAITLRCIALLSACLLMIMMMMMIVVVVVVLLLAFMFLNAAPSFALFQTTLYLQFTTMFASHSFVAAPLSLSCTLSLFPRCLFVTTSPDTTTSAFSSAT